MIKKTIVFILILFIAVSLNSYEINGGKYSFYQQNNNTNFEDVPVDEDESSSAAFHLFMLVALAPFYLPEEIVGYENKEQLKFQNYPFENTNSFYFDEGKNWCFNSSLLFHYINTKDETYGFGSNIDFQYNRFGLQANIYQYKTNHNEQLYKFSIYPFYTFARNRFINFQTGIGYNYEKSAEKTHWVLWNYRINVYSKPIQLQISNDLNINFPNNEDKTRVDENLSVKISYYIKHFSASLGYYFNSINNERLYGPNFSINYLF